MKLLSAGCELRGVSCTATNYQTKPFQHRRILCDRCNVALIHCHPATKATGLSCNGRHFGARVCYPDPVQKFLQSQGGLSSVKTCFGVSLTRSDPTRVAS